MTPKRGLRFRYHIIGVHNIRGSGLLLLKGHFVLKESCCLDPLVMPKPLQVKQSNEKACGRGPRT